MSSNCESEESQRLLPNNTGKSMSWDSPGQTNHVAKIHVQVDNLHNGLSRRDKNGDSHQSASDVALDMPLERPEHFSDEKWKSFLAFTFLAVNMTWTLTVLSIVHERMPERSKYPPLPDVFFDVFPQVDWALDVSEIIIIASVWLTLIVILLHKSRFIILRRCFLIIGLLYFMRSITMFVTQVPVSSTTYYCSPKANTTSPILILKRVLHMMSGFGLSINGRHTFCGDYIYSGHTVILTMTYLVIREYSPKRYVILHWLVKISSCTGIFMVLLSRGHYTVDVVIGYYITSRVFWIYHTMANNDILKVPGHNNYLCNTWWFFLFSYFEKNVGEIQEQYEWPLPSPRRFFRHTRIS